MKKCNTELMKELKAISHERIELLESAKENRRICYYEGEEEPIRNFDYNDFMAKLQELNDQERHIKSLLAYSNATTKLMGMEELTISEGLIKLAQLNNTLRDLSMFKTFRQTTRDIEHAKFEGDRDRVHVYEFLYDGKQVEADIKSIQREISRLQMAIDRTNLTNMIEC